jgi:hypothetical protein
MAARPVVAVFDHIRQNEHDAVLQSLELHRLFMQLRCPLAYELVDVQMCLDPVYQHGRGKGLCDEIDDAHLKAADFHIGIGHACKENDRDVYIVAILL